MVRKILTGTLLTYDLAQTPEIYSEMKSGDVFVTDRAFCSYAHLALLMQAEMHAVFRVGGRRITDFTPNRPFVFPATWREAHYKGIPQSRWIKQLGKKDQIVDWLKTKDPSAWFDSQEFISLPDVIEPRALNWRPISYSVMARPRAVLRQALLDKQLND